MGQQKGGGWVGSQFSTGCYHPLHLTAIHLGQNTYGIYRKNRFMTVLVYNLPHISA
jgi:hypothetical protein